MLGVSVYLAEDLDYNLSYLNQMKNFGVKTIFTSLHLEDINKSEAYDKLLKISEKIRENDQELMVDISNNTLKIFEIDFDHLKGFLDQFKIKTLRIDFGFSPREIEVLSRDYKIVLNASTIDLDYKIELEEAGLNLNEISLCHNFYPRLDTGLSEQSLKEKNDFLRSLGFKIQAFIPGDKIKRGPFREGLPTVEDHRFLDPFLAYVKMKEDFAIDEILLGDIAMNDRSLAKIMDFEKNKIINLTIKELFEIPEAAKDVFYDIHQNRDDYSDRVVRASQTRLAIKEKIKAKNTIKRKAGSITIDNEDYLRYNGELQIAMVDLKEDKRVNVIGYIKDCDIDLLSYIKNKYSFRFIKA